MSNENSFKVGDTVCLNSGGPVMTVSDPRYKAYDTAPFSVECAWFCTDTDNETHREIFLAEMLHLVEMVEDEDDDDDD